MLKIKEEILGKEKLTCSVGIGPKTEELFKKRGAGFIRDLKKFSKEEPEEMPGKWGIELYDKDGLG